VREGLDPRHPAFAVSLRMQASFEGLAGWLDAVAQAPASVAMQPLRISASPEGGVRIEARALAFRGVQVAATASHALTTPAVTLPPAAHRSTFADAVLGQVAAMTRTGGRDPFDPKRLAEALGLNRVRTPSPDGPDMSRVREPLESYELRDVRLLGVLQSDARRVAIVQAGGAQHRVEVGHGRVERVADNGVELIEWALSDGRWQRRGTRLLLQPGTGADGERAPERP
jgi:Tfp pilus assembly protein PilP